MKITDKGQVTIPIDIRRKMGLLPNTDVEFVVSQGRVILRRKSKAEPRRGKKLIAAMRGRAAKRMSTDEIMALTRGD